MQLEIIYLSVSELKNDVNNSRLHSAEQITAVANSINEFGFTNPILIDTTNTIKAGHCRLAAAKQLGLETVPCIRLANLTADQLRAYVIADNQLALGSEWDLDKLRSELEALTAADFNIALLGFDADALSNIVLEELEKVGLVDDDDIPPEPEKPRTQRGDIWLCGNHRVMCGDSTSIDNIEKLMGGKTWDLCIFDPPYQEQHLYNFIPDYDKEKKLIVMWDFKRFGIAAKKSMEKGWNPLYEFIWDCVQSWYTPNRPLQRHKTIGVFGENPFFNTDKAIIKDGKYRGSARVVKNTRGKYNYQPLDGAKHISTVEAFSNVQEKDEHGHGKPIAWLYAIYAGLEPEIILDLFGGSGSSIIVAQKLGVASFTMELSEKYCDVIVSRWEQFTGNKAILLK